MSDLIDDPAPGQNAHEYTVSEISGAVKRVIEGEFGRVRVRGEVGRVFKARSGHLYFDIKDDRSVLASVTWKGQVAALGTLPEEGMEVVATGQLTTFGSQSKYQLTVDDLRPAGVGALMAMLEKRKKALAAEGLFDESRKQALPFLPEVIGVVTSPSGAVIRDILHRLRERFPRRVLVWPVAVQGKDCAPQVARAIRGFNALSPGGALPRPDLIIVARGGGSIEDLWGFNEEVVARAAAESEIPLISAVGHETDTTLIDFVSDKRAPTPTAAAELAVPVRADLLAWVTGQGARLTAAPTRDLAQKGQRLRDVARALPRLDSLLAPARQRLDLAGARLPAALTRATQDARGRLTEAAAVMRPRTLRARIEGEGTRMNSLAARLPPGLSRALAVQRDRLDQRSGRLSPQPIGRAVDSGRRDLDRLAQRLHRAFNDKTETARGRLDALERLRQTLGYEATLQRGYAVVLSGDDVITTAKAAAQATSLTIRFGDGDFPIGGAAPATRRRKPKPPKAPPEQGELL
ncbi:exodeoxyribonuclease VII large subunit [Oceaniglobus trochenteri]|uniref:exodeoxyribonuclease VII large subunit n=1 Tax=Oceaniglobus trochenteri TaxID=2763260 RepID=UPI001CFF76BC|nr:exodeoxyribonuclease VII large subunit [Oceaniglobus trochenteri]